MMSLGRTTILFFLAISICFAEEEKSTFLLRESKQVVKTSAGEMKVMKPSEDHRVTDKPILIGFITMEPKSLFLPQYLDSTLILFIRRGEAKIGTIYKDELVEKQLKIGDLYQIKPGSTFYIKNTGEGQRLHIVCGIESSTSTAKHGQFQSFFVGGGTNPASILSGFGVETLSAALNVSVGEVEEFISRQEKGAIIYTDTSVSSINRERTWLKLLYPSMADKKVKEPDAYNLYERTPDFKNDYGSSIALEESDWSALEKSGIGVYLVNLTAGSMMVPHLNPSATEYSIVLSGSGSVEVVDPDGSTGTRAEVREGDVFWVPRYFAFCQIASRTGPMEFFGFSSSADPNRPLFLVGGNSILSNMKGPEMAAAFGVTEKVMERVSHAQRETVILLSPFAAPTNVDNSILKGRCLDSRSEL